MPGNAPRPALSPTALASHLACAHLTQLERRRRHGELKIELVADARLEAMRERGLRFERAFVDGLRRDGLTIVDLASQDDAAATVRAMADGPDVIVQAPLQGDGFRGRADVLLRCRRSRSGGCVYEPVDTKLARETKAGAILQLLCYGAMLAEIQGERPEHFWVQTPLRRERYRTTDFAAYHRFAVSRLAAAMADPPAATYPEPVPHCELCRYWQHCDAHRRADDHLSLVAHLGTLHARELRRQGIATLARLAACGGVLPQKPERGNEQTFEKLGHQARLQLAAREQGTVPFELLELTPRRGLARLPEPSPGDVFLDFEGDPFVSEGGREYLTGWLAADGTYRSRWAFAPLEERGAVEAFLDFVAAQLRAHPGMHVYHFAPYEPAALKRLCMRYGTRAELLDELLRGQRFVDLHAVVREGLRIGVESYGLKALEPLIGFVRELDLRAAAAARQQLEIALELGSEDQVTEETKAAVRAYNEGDCRATRALRDWLEARRRDRVAEGIAIDRPAPSSGDASEHVTARDARIAALGDALRASVPDDPALRTGSESALALLADLLGYFRREEKCAWWEHYRLRELPPDERLDEREMLAGLELVRTVPKVGRESVLKHVYRFPPQETGIDDEPLYLVADEDDGAGIGTLVGTAVHVDPVACEIVIRKTNKTADLHPTCVFRQQVIGSGVLEEALLAFGEHVRDQGLDDRSAWGAARDLLLRRPPQRRFAQPLQNEGETVVDALARTCLALDRSVLPVQGPPGTGKSWSGARAILALVAAGKRVGITAVSHKVIDNLLEKVRDAAPPDRRPELVHKHDGDPPPGVRYESDAKKALAEVDAGALVGGTAWLWASRDASQKLDYLFVDEAGQMAMAQVIAASRAAHNLVLLGDPMQLEQPRRGAHPDGTEVAALVHLLGEGQKTLRDEQGLFLRQTWRLHPSLGALTSELYYDGKLSSVEGCARQALAGTDGFDGAGPYLVEVPHEANQARSDEEVAAACAVVQRLLQPGATCVDRAGQASPLTPDHILVVAPYNAQVTALARALRPLRVTRVGTVDRFQGQEAPVVLYSCASSSADDAPRGMTFLYDPHRFNVATSRAQACVVVLASPRLFTPLCRTPDQMRMANALCRYAEVATRVVL